MIALLLASLAAGVASAQEGLPPRSAWRASASSPTQPTSAPQYAIDGDPTTEWGGSFAPGNWLQVDLSRAAWIGGAIIHWDAAYASTYLILSSEDGEHWRTAYQTADSRGGFDYVFFPAVHARYLRLANAPTTTDWGVAVFEFEPLAASDVPRISGLDPHDDPAALWSGYATGNLVGRSLVPGTRELSVVLPRPLPVAGLEVYWESARRSARLEGRGGDGAWQELADDPLPQGDRSYLAAPSARTLSELRLTVRTAPGHGPAIRRLRLLSPTEVMTTLKRYEIVAGRAHRELFPATLHDEQVYWTVVGVPAGREKSLFDEYGDLEAFKGAPLVQPLWRDSSGRSAAAFDAKLTHSLREGWMPMPAVQWSPQPGLELRSESLASQESQGPVTWVRHRLTNTGTRHIDGTFAVIVRPVQVDPPWQHGGISAIHEIRIAGPPERASVSVNGRTLFSSLTRTTHRGAAPFGTHGETEITHYVADGRMPLRLSAAAADGLAAAALSYQVHLQPGASQDILLAFPLAQNPPDTEPHSRLLALIERLVPRSRAAPEQAAAFEQIATQVAQQWQQRLGQVTLSLPDRTLIDMLRAQIAYMLLNQSGPAMEPGPRNYSRSFIRDGSATAQVLLRLGLAPVARNYLRWYSDHALHPSGLVSPILNADGSVNRGFGSDIEYDSQGEYVALVAQVAHLDGGPQSVREYLPQVRLALKFLEQLRERTLVPGYMATHEMPQRFHGLIAPSISHEGYSTPTHSYWDDYWALKAWHDGAWLAQQLGDADMARWALAQYGELRQSLADSIRFTMKWGKLDYIPASADLGDGDPTSVSIGIDPCGQQDLLPPEALQRTFDGYLANLRSRSEPNALYAYTPYEFRNVLSFVHFDRPADGDDVLTRLLSGRRPANWQVLAEVVRSQARHPYYLGDMPHTWVGAEYVRALIGMLLYEEDARLDLLPGVPPAWLEGEGVHVAALPTAFGALALSARETDGTLRVQLDAGLRPDTPLLLAWPRRTRPISVTIDGQMAQDYSADGIRLERPFHELIARW